jgi:hypothetical protein
MRNYQISFYKKLLSSDGHQFNCLQRTIDVAAESADEAVTKAKEGMRTGKPVPCWIDRADDLQIEER